MSFSSMMMNSMGNNQLLPQNLVAQQQQQSQQDHQDMTNFQNGPALASLLRQNNQMQGIMNMGGMNMNHGMGGGNQQAMMAMMNNQANGNMGGMGMNNLNINDLKRLQQLQAQLQSVTPNNSLFQNQASSFGQETSAANWQNYLDQKLNPSRVDDSLRNQLGMNGMIGQVNPLLGSNLFQERMMMNQSSALNGGFNKPLRVEAPLPTLYPLLPRDKSKRMRGGVIEPFPERLHRLLLEVEAAGRSDVISFVAEGRAFAIHKPDKLIRDIVPLYFRQSRLSSFKRQLNLYGFELITKGPARGGYYHENFVKDNPEACRRMRRVAIKTYGKTDKKEDDDDEEEVLPAGGLTTQDDANVSTVDSV